MDKPLKICMKHTAIKELPHSFGDLIGLGYLDMTSCKELQNLPSSLFVLPNVVTLKIGGCSQLRESLARFNNNGSLSISECWLNLETLHFSDATLSDEDLHLIIQSFPYLKDLNVSSNHVVSVPECIKESICLKTLDLSYCLNFQKIPELPSCVQKVDLRHCNSLTSDTSSMLWTRVRKEINRLEIVMPEWWEWDYCEYWSENPVFWARRKFPVVAIALEFEKIKYQAVGLQLFIDGEQEHVQKRQNFHVFNVAEDHVLLCDLRILFGSDDDEEWKGLDAHIGHDNEWETVEVKCESETDMVLRQWGVYRYKKYTNMDDLRFDCPYQKEPWLFPLDL